jgi:hypothetical protein
MFYKQKTRRSFTARVKDLKYSLTEQNLSLAYSADINLRKSKIKILNGYSTFCNQRLPNTLREPPVDLFCTDTNKQALSVLSFLLLPTPANLNPVYGGLSYLLVWDTNHSTPSFHIPQCHIYCQCGFTYQVCKAAKYTVLHKSVLR